MKFENIEMKKEAEVPSGERRVYDYTNLIKKAKLLTKGNVLQVPIEKDHQIASIQSALRRLEKNRRYRVSKRTISGEKFAIVKLAEGY